MNILMLTIALCLVACGQATIPTSEPKNRSFNWEMGDAYSSEDEWRKWDQERSYESYRLPTPKPFEPYVFDKDCSDFDTQYEAQEFYREEGPGDRHRLDRDRDGRACEVLSP